MVVAVEGGGHMEAEKATPVEHVVSDEVVVFGGEGGDTWWGRGNI